MKEKLNIRLNSSIRRNNGGYSLVELIIAVTILAVVALTCSMLMNSGMDLFSRVNTRETLQYKSQLALMQMKEQCVSAIGICNEEDNLHIITKDKAGAKKLYSFSLEKNDNYKESILYLVEYNYHIEGTHAVLEDEVKQPICSGVSSFTTNINASSIGSTKASSVELILTVTNGSRTYTKTYTIALKADPDYVKNKNASDTSIAQSLAKTVESSDGTSVA